METRDLKTFVTVASLLNFNQASKVLHTAQSTVSVRIHALEQELKTRLFDRLGRRIVLTAAGERLLEYARKMLAVEEEARAWVGGEEKVPRRTDHSACLRRSACSACQRSCANFGMPIPMFASGFCPARTMGWVKNSARE